MAIQFPRGFVITTDEPIDIRLVLTKAEMKTAPIDFALPSPYFCLCVDDHQIYSYDINNPESAETGKFMPADAEIQKALDEEIARAKQAEADLNIRIDSLDYEQIGEDGKYIKYISEDDGLIKAILQSFDTTLVGATDKNAPTTKAVKDLVEATEADIHSKVVHLGTAEVPSNETIYGKKTFATDIQVNGTATINEEAVEHSAIENLAADRAVINNASVTNSTTSKATITEAAIEKVKSDTIFDGTQYLSREADTEGNTELVRAVTPTKNIDFISLDKDNSSESIKLDNVSVINGLLEPVNRDQAVNKGYTDDHDTHYFEGVVSGSKIENLIDANKTYYCTSGTTVIGRVSSDLGFTWTIPSKQWAANNATLGIFELHINYTNRSGNVVDYDYTFNSFQEAFTNINSFKELNGILWCLNLDQQGLNDRIYPLYESGRQTIAIEKPWAIWGSLATVITLKTSDLTGCTINSIKIKMSSSIDYEQITLNIWAGDTTYNSIRLYNGSSAQLYSGTGSTIPGSNIYKNLTNTFVSKGTDNKIVEITPLEEVIYCNLSNNRLYRFDNGLVEVSGLGHTADTAYPGDEGLADHNRLDHLINQNDEFYGNKAFHGSITIDNDIHTDSVKAINNLNITADSGNINLNATTVNYNGVEVATVDYVDDNVVHRGTQEQYSTETVYGSKTWYGDQTFRNNIVLANTSINGANYIGATYATIENLTANKLAAGLDANSKDISNIYNLSAHFADFEYAEIEDLKATKLTKNLNANNYNIYNIWSSNIAELTVSNSATIASETVAASNITTANITTETVGTSNITTASITNANITNAGIDRLSKNLDANHKDISDITNLTVNNESSVSSYTDNLTVATKAIIPLVPHTDSEATSKKYVDDKLNYTVHIEGNSDEITYDGDTVTKTSAYRNLNTGTTGTRSEVIHLANGTTAGLMSHADYNQIRDNTSRIENLEGQTIRLFYTASSDPSPAQVKAFVDAYLAQTGVVNPTPADYAGIAVVVKDTYHIWHFYSNDNIGWRDDGSDTVTLFTNNIAGIIKGSALDGYVYANLDGTGSINGWSALKARVANVEDDIASMDLSRVGTDGNYIKFVEQTNGHISADIQSFDRAINSSATHNNAPTTKAVKDLIETLDLAQVGTNGSYIKYVSQTDGQVAAEQQVFDLAITSAATDNNAPTTKAVWTAFNELELARVGDNGKYIKYVSQSNGQLAATEQAFDTNFNSSTNDNAPTTKLVKDSLDSITTRIDNLDFGPEGANGNYIKFVSQTDGLVSATKQAFDTAVIGGTNNNAPTTKAVDDTIVHRIGNITETVNGHKSFTGSVSFGDYHTDSQATSLWYPGSNQPVYINAPIGVIFSIKNGYYATPVKITQATVDNKTAQYLTVTECNGLKITKPASSSGGQYVGDPVITLGETTITETQLKKLIALLDSLELDTYGE